MARLYPALAIAAVVTLLVLARAVTFRGDDWDLVAGRSLSDPVGLMRPFNEVWIFIPAVIFRVIFAVVGMHSYLPYLVVLLLLHVLFADAVRRLVSWSSGPLLGYLVAVVVLFLGTGAENLRWAFQIGMVGSAASGIWAMFLLLRGERVRVATALLLVSVGSHPVGAAFLAACIIVSVIRDRRSLAWLAVPCALLAVWFLVFDIPAIAARSGSFASGLIHIPSFIVAGVATAAGSILGLSTSAGIIILAFITAAAVRLRPRPSRPIVVVGAFTALAAEYALVAISRSEYGISSVAWSRYIYVAVPLLLVVIAAWFGPWTAVGPHWGPRYAYGLVAVTAVAVGGNMLSLIRSNESELEYAHRARAIAAVASWSADVRGPPSDVHIPEPALLRALIVAHGSPTRDDLVPFVVPAVPDGIARSICEEMLINRADLSVCLQAVADGVGSR